MICFFLNVLLISTFELNFSFITEELYYLKNLESARAKNSAKSDKKKHTHTHILVWILVWYLIKNDTYEMRNQLVRIFRIEFE